MSGVNSTFFFFSQEVILKRAADLVEALYGLPHNNQVTNTHTRENNLLKVCFSAVMSTVHPLLFCRRSSWSVRPTLQKLSTAFREDTPSCPAPPTAAWWGSTPSPGSCPSTSPSPRRPIRVRLYCLFNDLATTMKAFKRFLPLLLIVSLLDGLDRFWLDFSSFFSETLDCLSIK